MIKLKKIVIIFIFVFIFGLYKIINISFGYDTDILIIDHNNIMDSWLGLSRYGLVFLKYIFRLYSNVNLRFFNAITYINIFLYTVLFMYFLNIDNKSKNIKQNVLPLLLIVSSPILLEQYNFTLQAPEVSFSMILMILSFVTTFKYLKNGKFIYGIITVTLLVLCFGVYQAFVNLYILGALIVLYKLADCDNNSKNIIKCITIFVISLFLYYIISKLVIKSFNVSKNEYLTNQIGWFDDFSGTILGIFKDIIKVFVGYGHVLNLGYLMCFIIVMLYLIKEKNFSYKSFYLICMILSPFILSVLTGTRIVYRSLFTLPFLMSFIFFNFYNLKKWIKYLLVILLISQIINSYLLLISDYNRYKNDVYISKKIYNDCNGNKDTIIYLYGIERSEENIKLIKGEVMGRSFYEWSVDGINVTDYRVKNFMEIHGIKYVRGTREKNLKFDSEYPDSGYIIKNGNKCYVNLGK